MKKLLIQILFIVGKSEIPCLKSVPLEYIKSLINIGGCFGVAAYR